MTHLRSIQRQVLYAALLICASGTGRPAFASLLGVDFSGNLFDVDEATGAAANSRSTGISNIAGIADSSSGTLFGLSTFASSPADSLFRINPTSGASALVGTTGLSEIFHGGLAFNPVTGVLYGIQNLSTTNTLQLFTLNTTTGAASIVGAINTVNETGNLASLAIDKAGNLYVLDTNNSDLLLVNKANGAVLSSVTLSRSLGFTAGMAFDPVTGVLYVADGNVNGTNDLYTLNPASGLLSLVGATGISDGIAGLAFTPTSATPEPATWGLLFFGSMLFSTRLLVKFFGIVYDK